MAIMAVIAGLTLLYSYYYLDTEREQAMVRLGSTMEEYTGLLKVVMAGPLYDGDIGQLRDNLQSFYRDPDIVHISLTEFDGDIRMVEQGNFDASVGEIIDSQVLITLGLDELGVVDVKYTTANIERRLIQSRNELFVFSLVLILLISLVIYLIVRRLTIPIENLTFAASKMAEGDLDQDVNVEGAQELIVLGQSFITLRDSIKEKIEELEAKNMELERFVYTVSHELKSPLVTIAGFAGLLDKDIKQGYVDKVEHNIHNITSAIGTMSTLLDDLLELSRVGRLVNPPVKFNFDELVRDAVKSVSFQITERNIDIKILPDLPVIHGDRARLLEVLQNLIENSIKFMGDQPEPQIEIGSRDDGLLVACYVRDNGAGIDPSYHEKVFGLFDRLDPQIEGTGVGLALARQIVELHGGRIWVESDGLGKGSTFFFTIPKAA